MPSYCKSGIFTSGLNYNEQIYSKGLFQTYLTIRPYFLEYLLGLLFHRLHVKNAVLEVQENVEFRLLSRTYHQKSFSQDPGNFLSS